GRVAVGGIRARAARGSAGGGRAVVGADLAAQVLGARTGRPAVDAKVGRNIGSNVDGSVGGNIGTGIGRPIDRHVGGGLGRSIDGGDLGRRVAAQVRRDVGA